jgi:hypothetical protein
MGMTASSAPAASFSHATGAAAAPSATPPSGVTLIAAGSPLTRLNYFDGKFLRAADMQAEQIYQQNLVWISNQAGGPGIAYGFSVTVNAQSQFQLSPGLAIDPKGRLLLMCGAQTVNLSDLLAPPAAGTGGSPGAGPAFGDCPQTSGTGVTLLQPANLYLLVICHAETLCGQEDVYGKLCQEACVTSNDRPFAVEGIVVGLVPLTLQTLLPTSSAVSLGAQHLRSRVASAYFQDERSVIADLISKAGLSSEIWCLGADPATGCCLPLGVVGVVGSGIGFFDAWTARRERMDPPAKRYWQWRMRMRPWDVFLAQILQFQCQLRDSQIPSGTIDPCAPTRTLAGEAASVLTLVQQYYQTVSQRLATDLAVSNTGLIIPGGSQYLSDLITRITQAQKAQVFLNRLLINQGIIELPSAGYLPVTPGAAMTINDQVLQWMGEGVNLRFCVVTPDYVQHALEEAQHMERISLIEGLDNPKRKPDVDILVPNGQILPSQPAGANLFATNIQFTTDVLSPIIESRAGGPFVFAQVPPPPPPQALDLNGVSRAETLDNGGVAFYLAAETAQQSSSSSGGFTTGGFGTPGFTTGVLSPGISFPTGPVGAVGGGPVDAQFWAELRAEAQPFAMKPGDTTPVSMRLVLGGKGQQQQTVIDFTLRGDFRLDAVETLAAIGPIGPRQQALGRITALASIDVTSPIQPQGERAGSVVLNVTFETATSAIGPLAVLRLAEVQNTFAFVFEAKGTSANPLEVSFKILETIGHGLVAKTPVTGTLLASPDVAKNSNNFHVDAVSTVETLSAMLNDTGFSVAAAAKLFPPPPPPGSPEVIGTLDWVLFQRRRVKCCGPAEEIAILTRKYRVYLYGDSSAVFRTNAFLPSAVEVGVVEFAADSTTLLTSVATLLDEWRKVKPGDLIMLGGIYSLGDAATDGDTLAVGRLRALEIALAAVTPTSPAATNRILTTPPASTNTADVDGVIILMTVTSSSSSSSSSSSVSVSTRQYRLYWAQPSFSGSQPFYHLIGLLQFAGNSANLLTNQAALVGEWEAVETNRNDALTFGNIFNTGAAKTEGDNLGIARLAALETVLRLANGTLGGLIANSVIQTLPSPVLDPSGMDGVVIIGTITPQ